MPARQRARHGLEVGAGQINRLQNFVHVASKLGRLIARCRNRAARIRQLGQFPLGLDPIQPLRAGQMAVIRRQRNLWQCRGRFGLRARLLPNRASSRQPGFLRGERIRAHLLSSPRLPRRPAQCRCPARRSRGAASRTTSRSTHACRTGCRRSAGRAYSRQSPSQLSTGSPGQARNDEVIPRSRQGDVEQPPPFGVLLSRLDLGLLFPALRPERADLEPAARGRVVDDAVARRKLAR